MCAPYLPMCWVHLKKRMKSKMLSCNIRKIIAVAVMPIFLVASAVAAEESGVETASPTILSTEECGVETASPMHSEQQEQPATLLLTADSLVANDLRAVGVTFSHDNSIALFNSGQQKFDDMFSAISQARSSIHLEYFNFRNDSITRVLVNLLAQKVKEGVEVRALFDSFGNMSNNRPLRRQHLDSIRATGIEIYEFDPIRFPGINHVFHRDHRKIVVIDGQIAYVGGMNVADYYIHGTEAVGSWHDMHCRLDGEEVNTLQRIFLRIWNKTAHQNISGPQYYRGWRPAEYFHGLKADTTATAYRKTVGIINREPHTTNKIMRQFYISALDNAHDSIKIINPYITLCHSVKRAMKRALKRGVKMDIMISEKSDIPLSPDVSFHHLHNMMRRGANVYIYQAGFHHTKTIMVDGRVSTVGSCNLDARSLSWDYECNAVILDQPTTAELMRLFDGDKSKSFKLTEAKWKEWRTPWQRLKGRLASLLEIWL